VFRPTVADDGWAWSHGNTVAMEIVGTALLLCFLTLARVQACSTDDKNRINHSDSVETVFQSCV